jgi:hypothetical protein
VTDAEFDAAIRDMHRQRDGLLLRLGALQERTERATDRLRILRIMADVEKDIAEAGR